MMTHTHRALFLAPPKKKNPSRATNSEGFGRAGSRAVLSSEYASAITLRVRFSNVKGAGVSSGDDDKNRIVDPPPPRLTLVTGDRASGPTIRSRAQRSNPLVRVDHDLDLTVDDACRYIVRHPNVYQRNNRLVEVLGGKIREIPIPILRERLTNVSTFMGTEKRGAGEKAKLVPRLPSDHVVHSVFHRGDWNARELVGVTDTPIVRQDGTIVQTPGYDVASRFVYSPSVEFPRIPDNPSQDECAAAMDVVLEPLLGFPWKRTEDGRSPSLASYVSMLFTLVLVSTIRGNIPGWIISANVRGTGKTKLMKIASVIASGNEGSTIAFVDDDDEVRKRIAGALKRGARMIMFDNVRRRVSGDAVDILLTTRKYEDRVLGQTENVEYENNSVAVWTGNNLEAEGDTVRRIMPVDIDCDSPSPETRSFSFDPVAVALSNRTKIVTGLLTAIRGWYAAGCPRKEGVVLGSFEEWSRIVPQILIWLGQSNPLRSREASTVVIDRALQEASELANVWERIERLLNAESGVTAAQAMRALYPERTEVTRPGYAEIRNDLEALLGKFGRDKVADALGYRLRVARNRVLDANGRSIVSPGQTHGTNRWCVRKKH